MKRSTFAAAALAVLGTWLAAQPAAAQDNQARVRVVHASPDGPAVDVWVADKPAFTNASFKGITAYAGLAAGKYGVKVVPTGKTEPAVIDANLDLAAGTDYTVVAVGKLAEIAPLVLTDNNALPAASRRWWRCRAWTPRPPRAKRCRHRCPRPAPVGRPARCARCSSSRPGCWSSWASGSAGRSLRPNASTLTLDTLRLSDRGSCPQTLQ